MVAGYRVVIAQSAKEDVKAMKRYILERFRYRELAENFSKKIKRMLKTLDTFQRDIGRQNSLIVDI